jgi:hypothetical protein
MKPSAKALSPANIAYRSGRTTRINPNDAARKRDTSFTLGKEGYRFYTGGKEAQTAQRIRFCCLA